MLLFFQERELHPQSCSKEEIGTLNLILVKGLDSQRCCCDPTMTSLVGHFIDVGLLDPLEITSSNNKKHVALPTKELTCPMKRDILYIII